MRPRTLELRSAFLAQHALQIFSFYRRPGHDRCRCQENSSCPELVGATESGSESAAADAAPAIGRRRRAVGGDGHRRGILRRRAAAGTLESVGADQRGC